LAACGAALVLALGACGQKGPLYLPAEAGTAATPVPARPSAPADGRPAAPLRGASSPALPAAAN